MRTVVLSAAGQQAFSAGADLKERRAQSEAERRAGARASRQLLAQIESQPQPVIAAIHGLALGTGLMLALACDIRVAAESADLGMPEITTARAVAREIARAAPLAVHHGKRLIASAASGHYDGNEVETLAQAVLMASRDYEEGLAAFAQPRPPNFVGE